MADYPISRRTALKGLGVSMALPFMEAMLPKLVYSQQGAVAAFPRRMAVCYMPMGVLYRTWDVTGMGRNFLFSKSLQPLIPYRDDILILSGLACDKARAQGDGMGDHARAQASFLTGVVARKTMSDLSVGISMDQLAAQRIGNRTRFASLEVGCESVRLGGCDPGYSCTYTNNLSWRSATAPAPKETNPQAVFDRLFGGPNAAESQANRAVRARYNRSILDFVMEDARALDNSLGLGDQRRLDEYMASIRDIEHRIAAFTTQVITAIDMERPQSIRLADASNSPTGFNRTDGDVVDYRQHLRLLCDLIAVAFQTDSTRIATHAFLTEISNRSYRQIGIPDGHHDVSHHFFDPVKMNKFARINQFHVEQFAYLVGRLKSMPEGNGTVLDNSMLLFGSGMGEGSLHTHEELPIVLAGKGGGTLDTGRHVRYALNTPVCNLFVEMLKRMGVEVDSFGDSNGGLRNLG